VRLHAESFNLQNLEENCSRFEGYGVVTWCHSEIRYDGSECVCEWTGFVIQDVLSYLFVGTAGKQWTLSMFLSCWRSAEFMNGGSLLWIGDERQGCATAVSWAGRKWDWKPSEVFHVESDATVAITPIRKWVISVLDS
jgi:hypothetical protein